jgi:glycosyltransferase involved in cell wall biosynthesis
VRSQKDPAAARKQREAHPSRSTIVTKTAAPVSAVIPAYNSAAFILEAIESVRAQTVPVAELIVVVDDSTDGTAQIAESLGARVLSNGTAGLPAARNRGIRASSQPWIAFLDSDDIWEPEKIERQMELAAQNPDVVLVVCDYKIFDESGIVFESALDKYRSGYEKQPRRSCAQGVIIDELDAGFADATYLLLSSNVMVRRDVLEVTGLFDESLYSADDFDCFMRVLANHHLGVVEAMLVRRREHENNTSAYHPRAALSCLAVTYKVLDQPERYPAATVKLCADWLPANLRHAGAKQIWNGEAREGRQLLLQSAKLEFNLRTVLALAASMAPAQVGRNLMRTRYYISRKFGL